MKYLNLFRMRMRGALATMALIAIAGVLSFTLPASESAAQGQVEQYSIRWADGDSAPIELLTDFVAVDIDYDRVSMAMRAQTSDLRAMPVGISDRKIAIARVANESKRADFLRMARAESADYLGIPIRAEARDDAPIVGVATNEIMVRFEDRLSTQEIDQIHQKVEAGEFRRGKKPFGHRYTVTSNDGTAVGALQLAERYFEQEGVVYAHPNLIVEKVSRSDDPLLASQWHLNNTGQNSGVVGADAHVVEAWAISKGQGITIAVIDPQGVQREHEDLLPNRFINTAENSPRDNGQDDDGNGFRDDWSGWNFDQNTNNPTTSRPHGTAAAGVAAAACDNDLGGCGAAPEAKILGIAQGRTVEEDADAFYYAASMGADVISNSWGYPLGSLQRPTDAVEEAIAFAASDGRDGKGAVVVFAMTNQNVDNFNGPTRDISSLETVIAVGRSTNLDRWGKSGFGDGMELLGPTQSAIGDEDFGCLPDELVGTLEITTTDLMDGAGYNRGTSSDCSCNPNVAEIHTSPNYTACFGGTSSATPLVAGVAALVLSVNPELTREQVVEILLNSADKIDSSEAQYENDGQDRLYSDTHGYGRVNASRAVEAARATLSSRPNAPTGLEVSN